MNCCIYRMKSVYNFVLELGIVQDDHIDLLKGSLAYVVLGYLCIFALL